MHCMQTLCLDRRLTKAPPTLCKRGSLQRRACLADSTRTRALARTDKHTPPVAQQHRSRPQAAHRKGRQAQVAVEADQRGRLQRQADAVRQRVPVPAAARRQWVCVPTTGTVDSAGSAPGQRPGALGARARGAGAGASPAGAPEAAAGPSAGHRPWRTVRSANFKQGAGPAGARGGS